jgi:hypothetical protein
VNRSITKSSLHRTSVMAALLAVSSLAMAGHGGGDDRKDDDREPLRAQRDCDSLSGQQIGGATIGTATLIAATSTSPEYCKVPGLISPQLNFEIRLPTRWNRKIHFSGNGGADGSIPAVNLPALKQGYVDIGADGGHQGAELDLSFALNDPVAAAMFGHLYIPTVMATGLEIVKAHYGSGPTESYFEGCSTGGREALMMAQRFPLLFDGIIAGDPINNYVAAQGAYNRTVKALSRPGGAFTTGKVATLSRAVLAACDTLDGVADGIVSNAQACLTAFNPATLRCPGGIDQGDACLSDPQLAALKSLTGLSSFGGGAYQNVGWPLTGNETDPGAWSVFVTGPPSASSETLNPLFTATFLISDSVAKYFLARDPNENSLAYNWDSNPAALFGLSAIADATNPDLRPFDGGGGKLIIWNGGNSYAVSPRNTADYYQKVVDAVGGPMAANKFVTLYVTPGTDHCGGGPGAAPLTGDLLSALNAWVTKGTAPGVRVAAHVDPSGAITLTRPLCPFPKYPRYNLKLEGDVNAAASYSCANP